jgi:hypothetical protein
MLIHNTLTGTAWRSEFRADVERTVIESDARSTFPGRWYRWLCFTLAVTLHKRPVRGNRVPNAVKSTLTNAGRMSASTQSEGINQVQGDKPG